MRVLLLHNPKAGANDISADDLQQAFRDAGWEVEYMPSDGPEFTRRLASDLRGDCDLVAAAGGDGTLARVINGVRAPAPPLALLPLGTANNIASSLGIAGDPRDLIAGLADADSVPLDIAIAQGAWGERRFCESVGFGLIARGLAPVNAARLPSTHKIPTGRDALRQALRSMSPDRLTVALDGKSAEEEVLLLEVMRIPSVGPRLRLVPQAHPGDGRFYVATLGPEGREAMLEWLHHPDDNGPAPVKLREAGHVEIRWAGHPVHLDDRFEDAPSGPAHMTVTMQAGALRVRVPGGAANAALDEQPAPPMSALFSAAGDAAGRPAG